MEVTSKFWVPLSAEDSVAWDRERAMFNLDRFRSALVVAVLLHLALVIGFMVKLTDTEVAERWRLLIIWSHGVMFGVALLSLHVAWFGRNNLSVARVLPPAVTLCYLVLGASVASFDQLVTSAITPLVVANIGMSVLARLKPPTAITIHALGIALFIVLQGQFQADLSVRFSHQSNAVFLGGLGAILSLVFTSFHRRDYAQRRTIERQHLELEGLAARANAANRAKSEFLATMSHEIRTPLNGVLGVAELLGNTRLDIEQRHLVSAVTEAGHSLMTIINELLDFSKIEAGRMTLEHVAFDVRAAVEEVRALFAARATEKGLTLALTWPDEQPVWVVGDATRLKQVFSNLVGNAVKFTERGGVTIACTFTARGAEGDLSVRVTDTGIGITTEEQTRLFAPFMQADASTTRRFGGTGLGLAICKRLVEQAGGHIGVQSTAGQGSTFWCTLTLPRCGPVTKPSPHERATPTFSARVLLAEDNPVNVLVARSMLTRLGLEVVVARDGNEALSLFERERPAMVFTDLHMPQLDGFDLTRRLRGLGYALPIVALTADAMPEDRQRCLDVGMNDYLSKPFSQRDLERVLGRWLVTPPTVTA